MKTIAILPYYMDALEVLSLLVSPIIRDTNVTLLSLFKVLWIVPLEWLSWGSIIVALCLSGSVLVMTFWPAVRDDHPKVIIAVLSTIVALNVLLAVGCKVNALVLV